MPRDFGIHTYGCAATYISTYIARLYFLLQYIGFESSAFFYAHYTLHIHHLFILFFFLLPRSCSEHCALCDIYISMRAFVKEYICTIVQVTLNSVCARPLVPAALMWMDVLSNRRNASHTACTHHVGHTNKITRLLICTIHAVHAWCNCTFQLDDNNHKRTHILKFIFDNCVPCEKHSTLSPKEKSVRIASLFSTQLP